MYKNIIRRSLLNFSNVYLKRRSSSVVSGLFLQSYATSSYNSNSVLNLSQKCSFSTNKNESLKQKEFVDNKINGTQSDVEKDPLTPTSTNDSSNQSHQKGNDEINIEDEGSPKGYNGKGNGENGENGSKSKLFKYVPLGMYGGATLVFCGILLSYYIDRREELQHYKLSQILDDLTQYMYDKIEEYFPSDTSPLLPDFDELKYPPNLPTLVIDLDKVVAKMEYDRKLGWQVKKRPYADKFFKELINYYEIVIWSDDSYPVAYDIANLWGLPVIGCIHRDHCKKYKGGYIKDLSRLGRDLNRVILVDHDKIACSLQEDNAILIKEFDGDESDEELLYLINLLKTIAINPQDVKAQIRQLGGGHDYQLGRRFNEQYSMTQEKAKSRMNMTKMLGFKHYQ